MTKEEIKLRLFECIAANSDKLCDENRYMNVGCVITNVNNAYKALFEE